jgi:hypothetical protein
MSFDISGCQKKFEDLSGTINNCELLKDGNIFHLFVRDLSGVKLNYDTIVKEDIEPHFPHLYSYSYEQYSRWGCVFGGIFSKTALTKIDISNNALD